MKDKVISELQSIIKNIEGNGLSDDISTKLLSLSVDITEELNKL